MDRSGCALPSRGRTHSPINETKLAVLSVLDAFGRPVAAQELYQVWGEGKSPAILDYHLSSLVQMKVVGLVIGPELRFRRLDRDISVENH